MTINIIKECSRVLERTIIRDPKQATRYIHISHTLTPASRTPTPPQHQLSISSSPLRSLRYSPRLVRIPGNVYAEGAKRAVFASPESYPRYVGVDPRSPAGSIPEYLQENCMGNKTTMCAEYVNMELLVMFYV